MPYYKITFKMEVEAKNEPKALKKAIDLIKSKTFVMRLDCEDIEKIPRKNVELLHIERVNKLDNWMKKIKEQESKDKEVIK